LAAEHGGTTRCYPPLTRFCSPAALQELKSTVAAARLIQLVKTRATVVRLDAQTGLPGACPQNVMDCGGKALASVGSVASAASYPATVRAPAIAAWPIHLIWPAQPCTAGEVVIDQWEVVPGDCVRLYAGELVPGDIRIVAAKDLFLGWVGAQGCLRPAVQLLRLL
jgi:hypothetical protein